MRRPGFAVILATLAGGGLLVLACSGSSGTDIPSGSSPGTSGGGTSGSQGTSGSSPGTDGGNTPLTDATPGLDATDGSLPPIPVDAGGECTWSKNANPCGNGFYCKAENCAKGICTKLAAEETANNNPQCGCDGITYLNLTVAAKNGMSIAKAGVCDRQVDVACAANKPCRAGLHCSREVKSADDCENQGEDRGACWQLPASCAIPVIGANAHRCGQVTGCGTDCEAIKSGGRWYKDALCPQ